MTTATKTITKKQYREQVKFLKVLTKGIEVCIEEDSDFYDPEQALNALKNLDIVRANLEYMIREIASSKAGA